MKVINNWDLKWEKYNKTFEEYSDILSWKVWNIDFYDLLLVRNFKWWWAIISSTINDTNNKLKVYNSLFALVNEDFDNNLLIATKVMDLSNSVENQIPGFKNSYLSALLSLMFPRLFPIMDKFVLYGTWILSEYKTDTQKEMSKENYIKLMIFLEKHKWKTLRDLDKIYFTKWKLKQIELLWKIKNKKK